MDILLIAWRMFITNALAPGHARMRRNHRCLLRQSTRSDCHRLHSIRKLFFVFLPWLLWLLFIRRRSRWSSATDKLVSRLVVRLKCVKKCKHFKHVRFDLPLSRDPHSMRRWIKNKLQRKKYIDKSSRALRIRNKINSRTKRPNAHATPRCAADEGRGKERERESEGGHECGLNVEQDVQRSA